MSDIALRDFRALVLADPKLQDRLRAITDKTEFIVVVRSAAKVEGFDLTADDITDAIRAGRRSWIERWI